MQSDLEGRYEIRFNYLIFKSEVGLYMQCDLQDVKWE